MVCPVCQKDHWCLLHKDRKAAICPRVSEGCAKDLGDAGYLHLLDGHRGERYELPRFEPCVPARAIDDAAPDWTVIVRDCKDRATERAKKMASDVLGVSIRSLELLDFGVTAKGAWSFPMRSSGRDLVGLRIRSAEGKKWAYPGSRNGLFMADSPPTDPLVVCEGPTDTACAVDFGFSAIGRPSCNGAVEWCLDVARRRDVAIFADNDGPGLDGANKLAEWMVRQTKSCKVVVSPYHKDLREAKRDGLTAIGFAALISNSDYFVP